LQTPARRKQRNNRKRNRSEDRAPPGLPLRVETFNFGALRAEDFCQQ
jgi:hypothetical protein